MMCIGKAGRLALCVAATACFGAACDAGDASALIAVLEMNSTPAETSYEAVTLRYGETVSIDTTLLPLPAEAIQTCVLAEDSGQLPTGVTLDGTTCALSGEARALVDIVVTLDVLGTNGLTYRVTIPLTVSANTPVLSYGTDVPTAMVDEAFSRSPDTLDGRGAQLTNCQVTSGTLPAGIALNAETCVLSGTLLTSAVLAASAVTVTIAAQNSVGSGEATVTLNLAANTPVLSYGASMPTDGVATKGVAFMLSPVTLDNRGSAVTGCTVDPALPSGLSLSGTTCEITGTPAASSSAAVHTITATNGAGSSQASINLRVKVAVPSSLSYSPSTVDVDRQQAINAMLTVGSCESCTYAVSPALPSGFILDTMTGHITGAGTALGASAPYTVTGSNESGEANTVFNLAVGVDRLDTSSIAAEGTLPEVSGDGFAFVTSSTVYKVGGTAGGGTACGATSPNVPSDKVFSAPIDDAMNPLTSMGSWTVQAGALPQQSGLGDRPVVVGSDVYLFGSACSNNVLKGTVDASGMIPSWSDLGVAAGFTTGKNYTFVGAAGDKFYAFGNGASGTEIWEATMAAPATWTNTSAVIPGGTSVQYSNFFETDTDFYILRFGNPGTVYSASKSTPTVWTGPVNANIALPDSSITFIIGDRAYILGGHADRFIYWAALTDMTTWTQTTDTTPAATPWGPDNGVRIGNKVYVIGGHEAVGGNDFKGTATILSGDIVRVYN